MKEEQLIKECNEIIDKLKIYSIAEKYRIIKSLWESLNDVIKQEGVIIIEKK